MRKPKVLIRFYGARIKKHFKKKEPKLWKADLKNENEKNVTPDDLKFIFYQAEKRLDDGIKNFDATTAKCITFLTLSSALVTALCAYFFSQFDPYGIYDNKLITVIGCAIYTVIAVIRFVIIVLPKYYQPIGSYPDSLFVDDYFNGDNQHNHSTLPSSTWYLYLAELESYQRRIKQNADINAKRLRQFNQSAIQVCAMPIFGLLLYLCLTYFSLSPFF